MDSYQMLMAQLIIDQNILIIRHGTHIDVSNPAG
jgi:hypothetical protein